MSLEFIPRRFVREHLQQGWRLIKGHEYGAGDYAVLMQRVERPRALSEMAVETAIRKLRAEAAAAVRTKSQAGFSRSRDRHMGAFQ